MSEISNGPYLLACNFMANNAFEIKFGRRHLHVHESCYEKQFPETQEGKVVSERFHQGFILSNSVKLANVPDGRRFKQVEDSRENLREGGHCALQNIRNCFVCLRLSKEKRAEHLREHGISVQFKSADFAVFREIGFKWDKNELKQGIFGENSRSSPLVWK